MPNHALPANGGGPSRFQSARLVAAVAESLGVIVRSIALSVVFVAIIGGLVTWIALQPPPSPAFVSVWFVGFTNDATGIRVAKFAVRNRNASAVRRMPTYCIEIRSPQGWKQVSAGLFPASSVVGAGASEFVALPPPTNSAPWRVLLYVNPDGGPAGDIKRVVASALGRVGIRTRYRATTCQCDSDLVENPR